MAFRTLFVSVVALAALPRAAPLGFAQVGLTATRGQDASRDGPLGIHVDMKGAGSLVEAASSDGPLGVHPDMKKAGSLVEAARDFDEEDDYDTWMWEHGQSSEGYGPAKRAPSSEENYIQAVAKAQCQFSETQGKIENGVVVFLVTRPADLSRFGYSLPRLWQFFLQRWRYPVRIFIPSERLRAMDPASYGNSPTPEEVAQAVKERGGIPADHDLQIETFDLHWPEVIEKTQGGWMREMNSCARMVSTSYKHMNQFFTKGMYEHSSLAKYRYYLRLDADFAFLEDLEADPFCVMRNTSRKFMWQTRKEIADPMCSDGLWEWFQEYSDKHGLEGKDPIFFRDKGARVNYVGYAGMGDLDFFRSDRVRELAAALNEDGRVYLNRWSDQTYYVLLLSLFEEHLKVGDIGFGWPLNSWCHKCGGM